MSALKRLEEVANKAKAEKYANTPSYAIPKAKYSDKTANDLTRAILDYFKFYNIYAVRINTQGQYNEKLGKWTKGTTTKGTADIHACYNGKHLSIEIKIGKDRMSLEQIETELRVSDSGGFYFVATDFEQFFNWINSL